MQFDNVTSLSSVPVALSLPYFSSNMKETVFLFRGGVTRGVYLQAVPWERLPQGVSQAFPILECIILAPAGGGCILISAPIYYTKILDNCN